MTPLTIGAASKCPPESRPAPENSAKADVIAAASKEVMQLVSGCLIV